MTRMQMGLRVLLAHLLLAGLLIAGSQLKQCTWLIPEEEVVVEVDLAGMFDPPEPEPEPDPEEPDPEEEGPALPEPRPTALPTPTPTPSPTPTPGPTPAPEAAPTATPRPAPTPTPRPRALTPEEIRARIQREQGQIPPRTTPPPPGLTAEQLQAMMGQGLSTGGSAGGAPTGVSGGASFGQVEAALKRRLYAAWSQPVGLSADAGWFVQAEVEVNRDGSVHAARVLRASGHDEMDRSVRAALDAVTFVAPLPPEFRGQRHGFRIRFEITQ